MKFNSINVCIDMNELKDVLNKIILLAGHYSASLGEIDKTYGSSVSVDSIKECLKDKTYQEERTALKVALEALPYKYIIAIQAVMYVGRGDFDSVGITSEQLFRDAYTYCYHNEYSVLSQLEKDNKKDIEINSMIDKVPLSAYLMAGIRKVNL